MPDLLEKLIAEVASAPDVKAADLRKSATIPSKPPKELPVHAYNNQQRRTFSTFSRPTKPPSKAFYGSIHNTWIADWASRTRKIALPTEPTIMTYSGFAAEAARRKAKALVESQLPSLSYKRVRPTSSFPELREVTPSPTPRKRAKT